jgi:prepilin-type processing-associated H-X9-DG protein
MLWLAAFFAQLGPSPVSDGFVSGDRAYLLLPPVPVCGNVIRSFGWSPDGKRAAILSIDAPKRAIEAALAKGEPPADLKWNLVLWREDLSKATVVSSGPASEVSMLEASSPQWIGSALYLLGLTVDERHPNAGYRFMHVAPEGRVSTIDLPSGNTYGYTFAQGARDLGALVYMQKGEDGYGLTVRFLRPDGPGASTHRLTAKGPTFEMAHDPSRFAYLIANEPRDVKSWATLMPDGQPGPPVNRNPHDPDADRRPFRLFETPLALSTGDGKVNLKSLWMKGASDSERSAALVSADSTPEHAEIAPTGDAVLYVSRGVAMVRRIVGIDKTLFLQMREAALRTEAVFAAKQCAMALIMYAADNDDVAPRPHDREKLFPYIKDRSVLDRFVYTFQGGSLDNLKNPSEVEIGYVEGPGGRAIAYADGHVKWRKD